MSNNNDDNNDDNNKTNTNDDKKNKFIKFRKYKKLIMNYSLLLTIIFGFTILIFIAIYYSQSMPTITMIIMFIIFLCSIPFAGVYFGHITTIIVYNNSIDDKNITLDSNESTNNNRIQERYDTCVTKGGEISKKDFGKIVAGDTSPITGQLEGNVGIPSKLPTIIQKIIFSICFIIIVPVIISIYRYLSLKTAKVMSMAEAKFIEIKKILHGK